MNGPLLLDTQITICNNQRAESAGKFQASDQRSKRTCPNTDALHML